MTSNSQHCPQCGAPLPANAPAGLCPRCVMAMNMATETEFSDEVGPQGTRVLKQPPTPAELADKFPQLEILELLGRGGMGAVYKARQKELDRIVALKILPPGLGDDPAFGERFSREAKALAKLNHPNIVTLYEFGRADGLFFFLMEFVDGVNLRQLLDTGRVASREALAIVPQICDALQYAHDQGIVHRDIKPENILMDRRGRVKVADFGLAKLVGDDGRARLSERPVGSLEGSGAQVGTIESLSAERTGVPRPANASLTDPGKIMGTPQYMAPEQRDKPLEVDHRADIYALGVVFYQMLTGELPGKQLEAPSRKVQIDVRLDEIVLRALEKKPELRFQSAGELKTRVETMASSATGTPAASGNNNRWGAAAMVLALSSVAFFCAIINAVVSSSKNRDGLVILWSFAALGFAIGIWRSFCKLRTPKTQTRPETARELKDSPNEFSRTPNQETAPSRAAVLVASVLIAAIWGCLADLAHGELGWFLGRLIAVPAIALGLDWLLFRRHPHQTQKEEPSSSILAKIKAALPKVIVAAIIVLFLRAYVVVPFYAVNDAAGPEVPRGSWVLVFRLARSFKSGDVIVYKRDQRNMLGRVVDEKHATGFPDLVLIERYEETPAEIRAGDVVGKVIFNTRSSRGRGGKSIIQSSPDTPEQKAFREVFGHMMGEKIPVAPNAAEASLESLNRPSKNRFLDLDSGLVVESPPDYSNWSRIRREQWLRESGIDLMVMGNNLQPWHLLTPVDNAIQLTTIPNVSWERGVEPDSSVATSIKGEALQFVDVNLELISLQLKHHRPAHREHMFLFQTANGTRGMLRVSGTIIEGVETLAGLKIEFKKLQQPPTAAGANAAHGNRTEFGFVPKAEFAARLADGSFVELVSLKYGPGSDPRRTQGATTNLIDFWKPDGTRNTEYGRWSFAPTTLSSTRIPGLEYRGFVVHWGGPTASKVRLMDWEVDGNPDASGIFNVTAPKGESAENWLGVLQGFPSDQKTAKLRFALASGPYLEGPTTKTNFIWSRTDKTPWGSYSIGKIFDQNGNAAITLTHNLKGCDYRLYTQIDTSPKPNSALGGLIWEWKQEFRRGQRYKKIFGQMVKGGAGSRQSMEVWEFPGIPAQEAMVRLPSIYFEVRPVQWVEFRNVSLIPGRMTAVDIIDAASDTTTVPNGNRDSGEVAVVRLLSIEDRSKPGVTMWQPDGTHVPEEWRTKLTNNWSKSSPRVLWISMLLSNVPDEDLASSWMATVGRDSLSRFSGKIEPLEGGGLLVRFAHLNFSAKSSANVRFGFAVKPWRTVFEWKGKSFELVQNNWPGGKAPGWIDVEKANPKIIAYEMDSRGVPQQMEAKSQINVRIPIDESAKGHVWQFHVIDRQGKEDLIRLVGSPQNEAGVTLLDHLIARSSIAPEDIERIVLKVHFVDQDYLWTEFRNVALEPNPNSSTAGENESIEATVPGAAVSQERTVQGKELTVTADGSADHTTIQAAIDAAPDHATIRIGPGRYPENLVITKPLTLRGAGWKQTVIGPTEPDRMPSEEDALTWKRRIIQTADKAERERIAAEFQKQFMPAVLKIREAKLVACFDLKFTQLGIPPENGGLQSRAAVDISATEVLLKNCAVLGGPGDGVRMEDGAVVTIQNSLIAAAWNAGVRIGDNGQLCKVRITDSDIRNCYHRGIVIGSRQNDVMIERCRISGSAWHGIRYDDASPVIRDNIVFANARSGIYASGSTAAIVRGNLFWRNEMGGMSCWYSNTDKIEQNTFSGNLREGISILGMSEPSVHANIFSDHLIAIFQGAIGDPRGTAQPLGTPMVTTNLFWNNRTNWIRYAPQMEMVAFKAGDGNVEANPQFRATASNDYSLQENSPARRAAIGALNPLPITGPWPLQPEELAIIPDTDTRDYKAWKRLEAKKP